MSNESPEVFAEVSELRLFRVFQGMDDADLAPLGAKVQVAVVEDGQVLLEEGEPTDSLYFIKKGAIAFFKDKGGDEQLLSHLGVGRFFGELGLFGLDKPVSVTAVGEGCLLKISYDDIGSFLKRHPSVHRRLEMSATNMAVALEMGRRQEVRIRISQDVVLELDDGSPLEVLLENFSPGGMCLTWVPPHWIKGEKVRFVLKLPQGILHLSGRVVWRYKKRVGLALDRNLPNHAMVIQNAIRSLLESSL